MIYFILFFLPPWQKYWAGASSARRIISALYDITFRLKNKKTTTKNPRKCTTKQVVSSSNGFSILWQVFIALRFHLFILYLFCVRELVHNNAAAISFPLLGTAKDGSSG